MLRIAAEHAVLAAPIVAGFPDLLAEAVHGVRREQARERSPTCCCAARGSGCSRPARLGRAGDPRPRSPPRSATELGWDGARRAAEIESFRAEADEGWGDRGGRVIAALGSPRPRSSPRRSTVDGPSAAPITAVDGESRSARGRERRGRSTERPSPARAHVFVSLERGGAWAPPVQVDPGVAGGASAASVAAAGGGRVVVAWIAGGTLYGAVHAAGATAFTPPQPLGAASGQPALGIGISGTAYVAYAAPDTGGSDVDVARLDRTSTSFVALRRADRGAARGAVGARC